MIDEIESLIDGADLGLLMGVGPTARHERKVAGEITRPVKIGKRGARWPKYEGLVLQRGILAGLNKVQRIAVADYLEDARRTMLTKSSREIYEGGLALVAKFVAENEQERGASRAA